MKSDAPEAARKTDLALVEVAEEDFAPADITATIDFSAEIELNVLVLQRAADEHVALLPRMFPPFQENMHSAIGNH